MKFISKSIFSLLFIISLNTYSVEKFLNKDSEFSYLIDGDYKANYKSYTSLNTIESQQKEELEIKLKDLSQSLIKPLAKIVAQHANIISIFPEKKYSIKLILTIITEKAESAKDINVISDYKCDFIVKTSLSKKEELDYEKFEIKLKSLAENSRDELMTIFSDYYNIISFSENVDALSLETDIYLTLNQN